VHNKLVLGGRLDGQACRARAFQDLVRVVGGLPEDRLEIGPIRYQPTALRKNAEQINGRPPVAWRDLDDQVAIVDGKAVREYEKTTSGLLPTKRDRLRDIGGVV